jgi:8-oxo-dGTP pyrophosphatase MutT (NUDIX family)
MDVKKQAAGVAVFSPEHRLLLGRHAHDGRWATIGGSVEPGESHEEAARREAFEEVGLTVGSLHPLGIFADSPIHDVTYPDGTTVEYSVTMFATILATATRPMPDRQEILEVAWVARDDLANMHLGPDMAEIIPAAFTWLEDRSR